MFHFSPYLRRNQIAALILLVLVSVLVKLMVVRIPVEAETAVIIGNIPIVESEHPYANNTDNTWLIFNDTGSEAASIHFSRIELEDNVDRLELLDENDVVVQRIDTSRSDINSAPVNGSVIKIRLVSDSTDSAWGFAVDSIEAVNYPALAYSAHPYENNTDDVQWVFNPDANAAGTRVVFSSLFLEENVDYVIISDGDGNPYQWITGSHPVGLTSKAVTGTAVQVQLVSDNSVTAWGYNISAVETASPDAQDSPPTYNSTPLAESDHPYPYEGTYEYIVINPDPTAVNSKIHFNLIDMGAGDGIALYDDKDRKIIGYGGRHEDIWSDYVPGQVIKIVLTTSDFYRGWGFLVDAVATAGPNEVQAQSHHWYGSEENWDIYNPDLNAQSSKIHFEKMTLGSGDSVRLYDVDGTLVQVFGQYTNLTDVWSDYVPGRYIHVQLTSSDFYAQWGFRADRVATSNEVPVLAQSDHHYGDPGQWTITNTNVNAITSTIHFSRISISSGDSLQILDENDTVIQTFGQYTNLTDVWSNSVLGRVVKLKLNTSDFYNAWGFRVDGIAPLSDEPIPRAFVSSIYVNTLYPGVIYLDGSRLMSAYKPGEYKVPISGTGNHTIHIDYPEYTQDIQVSFSFGDGLQVVYLPLVKK